MADAFEVPNLQASDSDEGELSESESESEPVAKKGRGDAKPYDVIKNFQSEQLFKQWWENEKSAWTLQTTLQNKNQMNRFAVAD
ncbi:hypothetical protein AAVH_28239 [Aphelenchoides avenae]|nr:hypothetical protein AAVH_28239 [Aphelenchus avenae]